MSRLGKTIWETSRADESTISYLGANNVAAAILDLLRSDEAREVVAKDMGCDLHASEYGTCAACDETAELTLDALADWLGGDTDE